MSAATADQNRLRRRVRAVGRGRRAFRDGRVHQGAPQALQRYALGLKGRDLVRPTRSDGFVAVPSWPQGIASRVRSWDKPAMPG
jgi:hypothetical protein